MKGYKNLGIALSAFLMLLFAGCDVFSVLDKSPQDRYTEDVLWTDIALAKSYLLNAYAQAPTGYHQGMLTGLTDETYFMHGSDVYLTGRISAEDPIPMERGLIWWSGFFSNIQRLNIFLAHIDEVANSYPESERAAIQAQASVMKGEALFLRAFNYARLAMSYGGVPLRKEPYTLDDDFLSFERATFKETIEFIVEDCNKAAALLLNKGEIEMGRATKGAALALKSRVLLFAASDLTADGTAVNEYVGYVSPDREGLWNAAKNAAKAVMDLGIYELEEFGAPDPEAVAQGYYNFFRAKDLSSPEIIWGKMYLKSTGEENRMNLWNGLNGLGEWGGNNATQNLVDEFQMSDGSSLLNHFKIGEEGFYKNTSNKYNDPNPYHNREPRFYATILYDQARWRDRFSNLVARDPIGVYDRRTRINIENGSVASRVYGIDTRQGPVQSWNGGYTGYLFKKMMDHEVIGRSENNENVWIEFRYAEILLNYAEACLELGEMSEAETYINMIRNRAGLPDFTGDIYEALRHERQIELVYENRRWFDIRRWKILDQALTDAMGIVITETHRDGNVTLEWQRIVAQERGPVTKKMYWLPIPVEEINRAPQLVQNPGY